MSLKKNKGVYGNSRMNVVLAKTRGFRRKFIYLSFGRASRLLIKSNINKKNDNGKDTCDN
mgnify:CR=1 FL=1